MHYCQRHKREYTVLCRICIEEEESFAPARGSASLRELLDAVEEFRKHAMYPYPDCSDEKKMAFIKANERLDAAVRLNAKLSDR